jgi:hypothetical protein
MHVLGAGMHDLGDFPGGADISRAQHINDGGQIVGSAGGVAVSEAGFVTFSFSGTITSITDDDVILPAGYVSTAGPLSTFTVTFTYETTTAGTDNGDGFSFGYAIAPIPAGHSFSATAGNFSGSDSILANPTSGFFIVIENNGPAGDVFNISASPTKPAPLSFLDALALELDMRDSTGTVFSTSGALPSTLNVADFTSTKLTIRGDQEQKAFFIEGVLDTAVSVVPEPSSLALLSCGSISLFGFLLRRRHGPIDSTK